MICGNDPNAELTPGDLAMVAWFEEWLAWAWRRDNGDAGPEPLPPNGRATSTERGGPDEQVQVR